MPFTDEVCGHCGVCLHTDDMIEGEHASGCGADLPEEVCW